MPLNNFGRVNQDIVRCGQPDKAGIYDLSYLDVEYILKLNDECPEEADWCKERDIQLISFPLGLLPSLELTKKAVDLLNSLALRKGVCVHCQHGRDRTGLVVAAYRILQQNWPLKVAEDERKAYGVSGLQEIFDLEQTIVLEQIYKEKQHKE